MSGNAVKFVGIMLLTVWIGCSGRLAPDSSEGRVFPPGEPSVEDVSAQPRRAISGEDVEAFQAAVEKVGRLQFARAETEFRELLVRFESANDVAYLSETLFWLGYCLEKQSLPDDARRYYSRLIGQYPSTPSARLARDRMAILAGT